MVQIGTPNTTTATKFLLLGAGELGKEITIEAQRLGIEVVAVDRYAHAPAMQVAHRFHVTSMLDSLALRGIIEAEKPDYIIPEIEAIATDTLLALEQEGYTVVPTAMAAQLSMSREGIRRLAAEKLGLKTSAYHFAANHQDYLTAIDYIGVPCVVKPIMSSSGKGQSVIKKQEEIDKAWQVAQTDARGQSGRVIIEQFIEFDYEITLLTVRHAEGTIFCAPIGHTQQGGDFCESWQPHPMSAEALSKAKTMAQLITDALGGYGLFGVEFFVKGDEVYFSEVSPRPHDTGMVTLISQDLSQFALHVRAILGLPVPDVKQYGPSASYALVTQSKAAGISYHIENALKVAGTQVKLFGKPMINGRRRMGIVLAYADSVEEARKKAMKAYDQIGFSIVPA